MAVKTPKTPKPTPNNPASAPAEVKADVSETVAAPAATETAPPASTEAPPVVASVEEAPLAGAGEAEAAGGFLAPTGDETNLQTGLATFTHTISAQPEKGFCRAGKRWCREPTYVNRADWSPEQWLALTTEPALVVRDLAQ